MHGGGMGRSYLRISDEKPKLTRRMLARVLGYARPYTRRLSGMLILVLASTALSLLSPLIFRFLIDTILPAKDLDKLVMYSLALLAIPLLNGGITVLQRRFDASIGEGVIFDLRVALYGKFQRLSLRFFTHTKIGELMSRMNSDVAGAQSAISGTIVDLATNFIKAVAVLSVMAAFEWRLTLVSVAILPFFLVASRRLGRRLRAIARKQMDLNARMNAHMNETLNIGGALLVKLFGRARDEEERFRERASSVREAGVERAFVGSALFAFMGLVAAVGTAFVYGMGGYFVVQGTFTVGTIVAFGSFLGILYGIMQNLANAPAEFSTSVVSFERVFEVLDLDSDIVEKPEAVTLRDSAGDLEFENVGFSYMLDDSRLLGKVKRYGNMDAVTQVLSLERGRDKEGVKEGGRAQASALEGISFRATKGQLVALVGPSGAGKTSLTYLIPRLYDPTAGRILLDGHDIRDVTLASLAARIGMVTQETYLFHDTIRTNLIYARPSASQEEIESAAQVANIHDFIAGLSERYDTIVGERGYRLSGGEKQRLALARVILKDPRVLVLDEATSHLDSESEALIQEALKRVMAARTCIVIAHRLSTILAADLILVMDRGRIVERGTHGELIGLRGLYAQLYETQFKGGKR